MEFKPTVRSTHCAVHPKNRGGSLSQPVIRGIGSSLVITMATSYSYNLKQTSTIRNLDDDDGGGLERWDYVYGPGDYRLWTKQSMQVTSSWKPFLSTNGGG